MASRAHRERVAARGEVKASNRRTANSVKKMETNRAEVTGLKAALQLAERINIESEAALNLAPTPVCQSAALRAEQE